MCSFDVGKIYSLKRPYTSSSSVDSRSSSSWRSLKMCLNGVPCYLNVWNCYHSTFTLVPTPLSGGCLLSLAGRVCIVLLVCLGVVLPWGGGTITRRTRVSILELMQLGRLCVFPQSNHVRLNFCTTEKATVICRTLKSVLGLNK